MPAASPPLLRTAPPGVVSCDGRQVSGHPGARSGLGHPVGLGVSLVTCVHARVQRKRSTEGFFENSLWLSRRLPSLCCLHCAALCVFFTKHRTPPSLLNSVLFISSRFFNLSLFSPQLFYSF